MWSRIERIIWSSYFSYIEQNRICSSFNIITSLHYIPSHANTHTFVSNIWQDTDLWITQCQNKEIRSIPFKEENLHKNPVKPRSLLSSREDHTQSLLFESNSFCESNLFPPGYTFDQIQPTFPHQVIFIHLIQSNLRFHTRLSIYIWSNPTYVFTLGYLYTFDPIQPTFPH